jgi:DNA polymerase-3 subunit alpha
MVPRSVTYRMNVRDYFIRPIPCDPDYETRITKELSWITNSIAEKYILTVAEICRELQDVPYIIRGSAGSSLVAYLLGISNIDPVRWEINPERFFHPLRTDLPDIDLDFPDYLRDSVFERIKKLFPGRVARISNHVKYEEKSAYREAVRILGYRKRLPRKFLLSDVVPGEEQRAVEIADELMGTVKNVSLHCGGIIVFNDKVPDSLMVDDSSDQVRLDKLETEADGHFKIDILSSNSLSQLYEIDNRNLESYPERDELVENMLSKGNSLGITQAESPAFQKMLRAVKPKSLSDIVMCMALIRPASAWRSHRREFIEEWDRSRTKSLLVFEDDANQLIQSLTGLDGPGSDALRKAFMKKDVTLTKDFRDMMAKHDGGETIIKDIEAFRTFSMCKAHSVSYAYVTWALAYNKAYNPKAFWLSTLNHAQSMWRPWVHAEEAKLVGWDLIPGKPPFKDHGGFLTPKNGMRSLFKIDQWSELKKTGMWSSHEFPSGLGLSNDDEKVDLHGLIGTHRIIKKDNGYAVTFVTVGTSRGKYHDLVLDGAIDLRNVLSISGNGESYTVFGSEAVKMGAFKLNKL